VTVRSRVATDGLGRSAGRSVGLPRLGGASAAFRHTLLAAAGMVLAASAGAAVYLWIP
jgi:hypothetical protein